MNASMWRLRAATALFFLSGAAGLVYEIVWFKRFTHVWGGATYAMASVVASFLLGLGIGAHVGGRWADRLARPLRAYALCEALIGALALLVPLEISRLMDASAWLYGTFESRPALDTVARFLLTLAVIGPPCVLMGATLPLLVRQFASRGAAGRFYAVNALGAAAGAYVAGFHLLPTIGFAGTNAVGVAVNFFVAAAALALARPVEAAEAEPSEPAGPSVSRATLLVAAAFAGCGSLALEMTWARQLAVMLGGSTYALSATLVVVLLGIAAGSALFNRAVARGVDPRTVVVWTVVGLAIAVAIGQALLVPLTMLVGAAMPLRGSATMNAGVCLAAGAALEFLPSVGMGLLFPAIVHLMRRGGAAAGRAVGDVYAWNTVGTMVGAAATSALFIPMWGTAGVVRAALLMYGVVLAGLFPYAAWRRLAPRAAVGVAACAAILVAAGRPNPLLTDAGMYLYGLKTPGEYTKSTRLAFFKEGPSCNVMVGASGLERSLHVNGKVDASTGGDMQTQLGLAYVPRFVRPRAREVLVIGFGSGTTSGAGLLFPGTKVTCCEIEPAVFEASAQFAAVNHRPQASKDFSIVFDDGRRFVQGTRRTFDLIISEPSNPWIAGVSNLFTREFYEAARRRLAPGGVFAQWIQTYNLTAADYALVVRTMTAVFPHAALSLLDENDGDTILLASDEPLLPTAETIRAAQALVDGSDPVRTDLLRWFHTADVASFMIAAMALDGPGLRRLTARDPATTTNTDLNLRLEFDAPLRLFGADPQVQKDLVAGIFACADPPWFHDDLASWAGRDQMPALHALAKVYAGRGLRGPMLRIGEAALGVDPSEPGFLADRLSSADEGFTPEASATLQTILSRSEPDALRVGSSWLDAGRAEDAARVFDVIVELRPGSATALGHRALAYESQGHPLKAEETFRRALAIDPLNDFVLQSYEAFRDRHD